MPAYDATRFAPPAPLALVELRNPTTGATFPDVSMLLDTGADVPLLPKSAVDRLGVAPDPSKRYQLTGFDGTTSFAPVVQLELLFCRRTFRGQFLLIDQDVGILGRNVLNVLRLLLDGPGLAWDEHVRSVP